MSAWPPEDSAGDATRDLSEDDWPTRRDALRRAHPKASEGTLFCVYELQRDPTQRLPEIQERAGYHGLRVVGRSMHAAKVILGLAAPVERGKERRQPGTAVRADPETMPDESSPLDERLVATIRNIQKRATADSVRLRKAIERAIAVLREALEE